MFPKTLILFYVLPPIFAFFVHVKVKQGLLVGISEATVFEEKTFYAFYRVPYAKPPIGKLRFKDPVRPSSWDKPYDGTVAFLGACAQPHIVHKHGLYGNENCLFLNIYTPVIPKTENEPLRPVVVWIHGYAFTSSFSHIYGPDLFIEKDILFITLTHRISVFGFAKVNETDTNANMGLKDIVMGLKWIRRNIFKFGGDKNQITLMASGSAATFASLLLVTKAKKLFSKLILQSGAISSPFGYRAHDTTFEINKLNFELKKKTIKNLTTAAAGDIISAAQKIYSKKDVLNFQRQIVPFLPIIENKSNFSLLTVDPEEYILKKNLMYRIPILIGFNSQEGITEVIPFISNPHYLKKIQNNFKYLVPFSTGCSYKEDSKEYKKISNEINKRYMKNDFSDMAIHRFIKYTTDIFKYPVYKFIKEATKNNSNVFAYKFNYVGRFNAVKSTATSESNIKVKGAANGDEICYLLKCFPLLSYYIDLKNVSQSQDKKMIKSMVEVWTNFAITGSPTPENFEGAFVWPKFTSDNHNTLLLGKDFKLTEAQSEEAMYSFWNELYETYYAPKNCMTNHDEL